METQDNEKNVMVSVLAGIGIGVIVGAIAGLLLAPKSGSETRESVSKTLGELGQKISELSQQLATKVKTVVESSKQAMAEKVEQAGAEGKETV